MNGRTFIHDDVSSLEVKLLTKFAHETESGFIYLYQPSMSDVTDKSNCSEPWSVRLKRRLWPTNICGKLSVDVIPSWYTVVAWLPLHPTSPQTVTFKPDIYFT